MTATNPQGSTAATTSGVLIPGGVVAGYIYLGGDMGQLLQHRLTGIRRSPVDRHVGLAGDGNPDRRPGPTVGDRNRVAADASTVIVVALDNDASTDYTWGNASLTYLVLYAHQNSTQLWTNNVQAAVGLETAGAGRWGRSRAGSN